MLFTWGIKSYTAQLIWRIAILVCLKAVFLWRPGGRLLHWLQIMITGCFSARQENNLLLSIIRIRGTLIKPSSQRSLLFFFLKAPLFCWQEVTEILAIWPLSDSQCVSSFQHCLSMSSVSEETARLQAPLDCNTPSFSRGPKKRRRETGLKWFYVVVLRVVWSYRWMRGRPADGWSEVFFVFWLGFSFFSAQTHTHT